MQWIKWLVLVSLVVLVSCDKKDSKDVEGKLVVTADDPQVQPGIYRTEEVVQPSFRDYNAKETVHSEVRLEGDKVIYIAFRDGKEINRKTGTYAPKHHGFLLFRDGQEKPERHIVAEVTPTSFKMQNGRQGLLFKKVQ